MARWEHMSGRGVRRLGWLVLLVGCGGEVSARAFDGGNDVAASPASDPTWEASTAHPDVDGGLTSTRDATATPDATTPDATSTPPTATPDAGPPPDAGGPLDGDVGARDAAPSVPPLLCSGDAAVPDADILGYVPVVQRLGACSPTILGAYIADCYSVDSTEATCQAFYADAGDQSCVECLIPTDGAGHPTNNGGLLVDPAGEAWTANFPACLALVDPTNGPACAEVLEPQQQCELQACGGCATASSSNACLDALGAAGAACSGYDLTPCNAYFSDAGFSLAACATPEAAINVICGTGQ